MLQSNQIAEHNKHADIHLMSFLFLTLTISIKSPSTTLGEEEVHQLLDKLPL